MNRKQFVVSLAGMLLLLSSVPVAGQPAARDTVLLDALVSNLTHLAPGTRERALSALDDLGDPRAIPALIELLRFDAGEAPLITGILGAPGQRAPRRRTHRSGMGQLGRVASETR